MRHLPVDDLLPALLQALSQSPSLVLQAAPGTGKTTRVPPALLKAKFLDPKQEILVLEPRRLAAKMSARRVAQELGEAVGQTVGYQFRFENVTSAATRVRYLTEGMLMRRLIGDPQLQSVSTVILDEFHERHLQSDVSLAYLRHLQKNGRPDLRIVVMSATLDSESLAQYLGEPTKPAPILRIDAKQFEVTLEYLPQTPARYLDQLVKEAVLSLLPRFSGDILVFLPGMGEIRRAITVLEPFAAQHRLILCPLHGELSREEQETALRPLEPTKPGIKGPRKIILATNVAETSLTIEGVTIVIDSGLHRLASHSWWSGVPALRTRPTSRASAIQRTGRAGRTQPGHCLRLYTRGDFDSRPMFDAPEIQRADLTQTVLELGALGVDAVETLPWFERPASQSLEASRILLYRLGALEKPDAAAQLTPLGKRLANLPAHPRLGRLLLEAERTEVLEDAASLVAYLMESKLEGIDALQSLGRARMEESVWRVRSHLLAAFEKSSRAGPRATPPAALKSKEQRLAFAILCGFPDRVARKRAGQDPNGKQIELLFSTGGSTRLENTPAISGHDSFVILDRIDRQDRQPSGQTRSTTQIQSLCPIQEEWLIDLEPSLLEETSETVWDETRKRVLLASRLIYDQIILSENRAELPLNSPHRSEAAAVMLKHALGLDPPRFASFSPHDFVAALSTVADPLELEALFTRISLVGRYIPETGLPDFLSPSQPPGPRMLQLFEGKSSLTELKEIDWNSDILRACGEVSQHQLAEWTPEFVTLTGGRRIRVRYQFNQTPWIESRLQDFFGMKRGPVILKGRLPLTLHLLAPNRRALQVTTDLEGFWLRVYPELRPQLSRRYPRQSWPENP